ALSMIIYLITEEHIFYVGHRKYTKIDDILSDIKKNAAFKYFAEDHGFSNTLLPTLEDEKLRADLKAFEDCFYDDFAIEYLEGYNTKDSIEPIDSYITAISEAKDPFKEALHTFQNKQIQLALAYRYSLAGVLELRKKICPVFAGIILVRGDYELPLTIIENAFFNSLLTYQKSYKFKKIEGKNYRKKLKSIKKSFKHYKKLADTFKINLYEKLHTLYLEWVDLFKMDRVIIKDSNLEPTIPYCDTYASLKVVEDLLLEQDEVEKEYIPVLHCEYDLNKLEKSVKTHCSFSIWIIFVSILCSLNYVLFGMLPSLRNTIRDLVSKMMNKVVPDLEAFPSMIHILFFAGVGLSLVLAITILVFRGLAKKKYDGLCRLAYYRKNEAILVEKEQKDYDKLKENEVRYAKSIDRFYRFYGGVAMAGLSLAIIISVLGLIYTFGFIINDTLSESVLTLLKTKLYYLFIGPLVCMLLGFVRHKKSSWSIIFTCVLSLGVAVGLLFLMKL
ncbi:MAG: hypothetical protein K2O23_04750, partial [Anaeroplasmataceae bacterium]|nr:hypothetical protein [Anaeroplasmataceae bacterium]